MKSIVIYNSKRGSTEQYARWIAQDVQAEQCVSLDQADLHSLDQFDVVVYGGWIRGSGIVGLDKLKKTDPDVAGHLVVFGVGIAPASPENYMQVLEINLDDDSGHWKDVPMHILPGRYDPEKVQGLDHFLMAVAKRVMISGRVSKSDRGAAAMKAALENGMDRMSRSAVEPVVRTVFRKSGLTREEEDEKIEALKPQWKAEGLRGEGFAGDGLTGHGVVEGAGNATEKGSEPADHDVSDDSANSARSSDPAGAAAQVDPADTDAIMAEMLKRHDE